MIVVLLIALILVILFPRSIKLLFSLLVASICFWVLWQFSFGKIIVAVILIGFIIFMVSAAVGAKKSRKGR